MAVVAPDYDAVTERAARRRLRGGAAGRALGRAALLRARPGRAPRGGDGRAAGERLGRRCVGRRRRGRRGLLLGRRRGRRRWGSSAAGWSWGAGSAGTVSVTVSCCSVTVSSSSPLVAVAVVAEDRRAAVALAQRLAGDQLGQREEAARRSRTRARRWRGSCPRAGPGSASGRCRASRPARGAPGSSGGGGGSGRLGEGVGLGGELLRDLLGRAVQHLRHQRDDHRGHRRGNWRAGDPELGGDYRRAAAPMLANTSVRRLKRRSSSRVRLCEDMKRDRVGDTVVRCVRRPP